MPSQTALKYRKKHSLSSIHSILVLAFSPDGQLLASGDSNGKIQLWDTTTALLRQCFRGTSPALSLTWTTVDYALHGGFGDGNLVTVIQKHASKARLNLMFIQADVIDAVQQSVVKGLLASQNPVEILAADTTGCSLVTGGQHEVRIWRRDVGVQLYSELGAGGVCHRPLDVTFPVPTFFTGAVVGDWTSSGDLPSPPISSTSRNHHVVVIAVHWLSPDLLLVSYLNHGVM